MMDLGKMVEEEIADLEEEVKEELEKKFEDDGYRKGFVWTLIGIMVMYIIGRKIK